VPEYKSSRSQVIHETLIGGVAPATRVHIYLRNVPTSLHNIQFLSSTYPLLSPSPRTQARSPKLQHNPRL
jgi:hypothetical protein